VGRSFSGPIARLIKKRTEAVTALRNAKASRVGFQSANANGAGKSFNKRTTNICFALLNAAISRETQREKPGKCVFANNAVLSFTLQSAVPKKPNSVLLLVLINGKGVIK